MAVDHCNRKEYIVRHIPNRSVKMRFCTNIFHSSFWCLIILLLPLKNVSACFFRPTWTFISPSKVTEDSPNSVKLDKETLSIVQQTFVKTWISLGKMKFHCPSESGTFPDTLDCRKYYTCSNQTYTEQYCNNATAFEPIVQSCVSEESVPLCKRVQKLPEHVCNDTGVHIYEGHCDKFLLCTENATFVSTCNHGDMFDQKLKLCLPETEANCTSTNTGKEENKIMGKEVVADNVI